LNDVFEGRDRGPHRAALVLQCGLALHIAGRAGSIPAGIDIAGSALDSGQALRWLRQLENYASGSHPT
jgi:anthranilate phosphoribosyltransferase